MAKFPGVRVPRKGGSTAGRRQFFGSEGSADAAYPGTKKELRSAKHRVATTQCSATSASGHRCPLKKGHEGSHRLRAGRHFGGAVMQTAGKRTKSGRYTPS